MAAITCESGPPKKQFSRPRTFGIGGGFYDMEESHIRNVVDVNLRLKNNDESFPVEFDGEYRGGEE